MRVLSGIQMENPNNNLYKGRQIEEVKSNQIFRKPKVIHLSVGKDLKKDCKDDTKNSNRS